MSEPASNRVAKIVTATLVAALAFGATLMVLGFVLMGPVGPGAALFFVLPALAAAGLTFWAMMR